MANNKNRCCTFCGGQDDFDNAFLKLYESSEVESRIVYQDDIFVVVPTIGPIFKHHILILPKRHIERLSELDHYELVALEKLVATLRCKLSDCGDSVIGFEHGSTSEKGARCGIYHAHLHMMPVPSELMLSRFFYDDSKIQQFDTIKNCYIDLRSQNSDHYLVAVNFDNSIYHLDLSKNDSQSSLYPSQFFRKMISDHYELGTSSDWRDYQFVDASVIDTINKYQANI